MIDLLLAAVLGFGGTVRLLHRDQPLWGRDKWLGGVLGADGNIYGVPGHSKHILQIEPEKEDKVSVIGGPFEGKYKWLRGVAANDGAVYSSLPCRDGAEDRLHELPPAISEIGGPLRESGSTTARAVVGRWTSTRSPTR